MQGVRWHTEVLTRRQASLLSALAPMTNALNFYLAGGTGIALYLGHRHSVDLDWFRQKRLEDPLRMAKDMGEKGLSLRVRDFSAGTLHCSMGGVNVSFYEYLYPLLSPLVRCEIYGCMVASLDDIACMKLVAIAQRGSKKDFIDIYAICTRHKPLPDLIKMAKEKFELEDVSPILYGLTYFDDADGERMPRMLWRENWREIKGQIKKWVKGL
ncbi:MAG: hypothetical protein DRG36_06760 [Deltaproteobacteria bacterium]|nr:MAG: hypothetical protein DRG36_06760 [Deltaproteobacteria bacterium]